MKMLWYKNMVIKKIKQELPYINKDRTIFILSLITLFAGILRLYGLGDKSLWFDEVHHFHFVTRNAKTIFEVFTKLKYGRMPEPPFYHLLAFLSVNIKQNEFFVRIPSALAGIFLVPAVYLFATPIFDKITGFVMAILTAISPFAIYYSQESKPYSLFLLLSTLSFAYFFRLFSDKKNILPVYLIITVFMIFTHYFSIIVILSQIVMLILIYILFSNADRDIPNFSNFNIKGFFYCLGIFGVCFAILLPLAIAQKGSIGSGYLHPPPFSMDNFISIIKLFGSIENNFSYGILGLIVAGVAGILLKDFKICILFLLSFFMTILFVALTLYYIARNAFFIRYIIFLFPFFMLFIALGIVNGIKWISCLKKNNIIIVSVLVIMLILSNILSLRRYYNTDKEDWKQASKFLDSRIKNGQIIIVKPFHILPPLLYYLTNEDFLEVNKIFKTKKDKHIHAGWYKSISNLKSVVRSNKVFFVTLGEPVPETDKQFFKLIKRFKGLSATINVYESL